MKCRFMPFAFSFLHSNSRIVQAAGMSHAPQHSAEYPYFGLCDILIRSISLNAKFGPGLALYNIVLLRDEERRFEINTAWFARSA